MNEKFAHNNQFIPLLDSLLEGSITPEDHTELERLLKENPEQRQRYIEYLQVHSGLSVWATESKQSDLWIPHSTSPAPQSGPGTSRFLFLLVSSIIAATIFLSLSFYAGWKTQSNREQPLANFSATSSESRTRSPKTDHIALLTQVVGVEWDTPRNLQTGAGLSAGWLRFKKGTIQVELISGASVVIEGPAAFELISPLKTYCEYGKVRASVPEQAQGFTIETSRLNVVDLGTEFTLSLEPSGKGHVQVLDGMVELHSSDQKTTPDKIHNLKTGEGAQFDQRGTINRSQDLALPLINPEELSHLAEQQQLLQFKQWKQQNQKIKTDPALIAYYDFEDSANWSRTLNNKSQQHTSSTDGAIVGCQWTSGRWPQKRALEFKRTSDRVRLQIPGKYQSLTLMAWVRIEGFERWLSSLMLTDGYNPGNPHWQISDKGEMILGVKTGAGKNYFSPVVLKPTDLGRWIFLVTVYDHQKKEVTHYLDGLPVSHHKIENPIPLVIGPAEIGNWRPQEHTGAHSIRSLNGRLDEFALFGRALPAEDILQWYQSGKPGS
ncbi:LamG-like jellyroll fold domain-containing protein [uncultured Gimesia sp.]|uniref:LamG-like jellyroll fold domain-containing protein n=1 Tax=uncultured Gimesia sp. TaxID=1678688 RepID=UPI00260584B5|nr:LamG-like jellyroll fold domain-containing protein [uncultured Gimesia sp.]